MLLGAAVTLSGCAATLEGRVRSAVSARAEAAQDEFTRSLTGKTSPADALDAVNHAAMSYVVEDIRSWTPEQFAGPSLSYQ